MLLQSIARLAYLVADVQASKQRPHCVVNTIPCVTKTRAECLRLVVFKGESAAYATVTLPAVVRLQGWSDTELVGMNHLVDSDRVLRGAFGNGITKPILGGLLWNRLLFPRVQPLK